MAYKLNLWWLIYSIPVKLLKAPFETESKHKNKVAVMVNMVTLKIQKWTHYMMEFGFVDKIFGGAGTNNTYQQWKRVPKETLDKGLIAGYPMIGVQVTLLDGSYHSVDSSG